MSRPSKYSGIVVNLLIAVAISLVVNFSYVLLLVVEKSDDRHPPFSRELRTDREIVRVEGDVWISPDGHGYLLYVSPERLSDGDAAATGLAEVAPARDSVYIPRNSARFLRLRSGDHLLADALESHRSGGRLVLGQVLERNGEPFDYGVIFERPQEGVIFALQLFYFFVLAFLLLSLLRLGDRVRPMSGFLKRGLLCAGLAVGLYFIAPVVRWRTHELTILALSGSWLDYNLIMKCSFTLVVVLLYGQISLLLRQRQAMEVENEQLKSENLTTRYNMLVSQINPHFFFNSLNSLAMLVREGDEQKALTYIDQLSFSFRYIIRNGQNMLTTLAEELRFAEAYGYLFKIRYADKLFFDVDVAPKYLDYRLPVLTLQELLSNAVKHNAITKRRPLRVSIRVENGQLVVSNPLLPKLDAEPCTGIGLHNLDSRWQLITGQPRIVRLLRYIFVAPPWQPPLRSTCSRSCTVWRRPWRSRRCSKGSRRASSGSGRIRSPILCLWIFIWPTARRFGFSNGFRSRLPSFSRPPTTAMRSKPSRSTASTTCSNRSRRRRCAVRWRSCGGFRDWNAAVTASGSNGWRSVPTSGSRFSWCACATSSFLCNASGSPIVTRATSG